MTIDRGDDSQQEFRGTFLDPYESGEPSSVDTLTVSDQVKLSGLIAVCVDAGLSPKQVLDLVNADRPSDQKVIIPGINEDQP